MSFSTATTRAFIFLTHFLASMKQDSNLESFARLFLEFESKPEGFSLRNYIPMYHYGGSKS